MASEGTPRDGVGRRSADTALTPGSCAWCRGGISGTARRDSVYCSKRCRQAAHRFQRTCVARARATEPMRLAYADPPYPGQARRYYGDRPEYAGEVDHAELLSRLQELDGWALSTSSRALPSVLALCVAEGLDVRVASWHRGARHTTSSWPLASWEPVVFAGGRRVPSSRPALDVLSYVSRPRTTDPLRVIGTKPAAFIWWLFDLLGALPGDEFVDLFPGSGGIARAWVIYESRATSSDGSRSDRADASRPSRRLGDEHDASRLAAAQRDGSPLAAARRDAPPTPGADASGRAPRDASRGTGAARRNAA